MSDMDNFLGNSIIDSVNGARRLDRQMDGYRLQGERKLNIQYLKKIQDDREYIRTLENEIVSLKMKLAEEEIKNQGPQGLGIQEWEELEAKKRLPNYTHEELIKQGYSLADNEYKELLSKPFAEIAEINGDFKETYDQQLEVMANWMVSQKAFKELAIEFGFEAHGYTPEEVCEIAIDKKLDVLENKNNTDHNTNYENLGFDENIRQKIINKTKETKQLILQKEKIIEKEITPKEEMKKPMINYNIKL